MTAKRSLHVVAIDISFLLFDLLQYDYDSNNVISALSAAVVFFQLCGSLSHCFAMVAVSDILREVRAGVRGILRRQKMLISCLSV